MLSEDAKTLQSKHPKHWGYLLWLLARRDYSKQKLIEKLIKRKVSFELAKKLIAALEESKLFIEDNYTRVRIRGLAKKYYSQKGIHLKLRQEQVDCSIEMIADVFEEEGFSDLSVLNSYLQIKAPKLLGIECLTERSKEKERLIKKCQSRGHNFGHIKESLSKILDQ